MRILKLGSKGTDVMEIQSLLKKIGYNPGAIDGLFGWQTRQAVINFQKNNNLTPDGIIGPQTYKVLKPLLLGYDIYYIKSGDTFWDIAKRYYTTVNKIVAANPGLNPYELQVGQKIVVPYGIDVVDTNIDYTYEIMERDIEGLKARYPFIEVGVAGKSVLGKNLYYIRLGKGSNQVFYNASHHALEWITTPLLMKFTENFLKSFTDGKNIRGYDLQQIWNKSSIYIIPMVNPDGVDLVLNGLSPDNPYYEQLLKWNDTGLPFSKVWSANIRGVDLNHNYDALWEEYKKIAEKLGYDKPGPRRYPGEYPESEPESKAVADFTRKHNFKLTLSYHSQGQVIYWNFQNMAPPVARTIGEMFSRASGYRLEETYGTASYSGYKDWFIKEYRRPGYTIEVGKGTNPLPISQFPMIYNNNEEILLLAAIV
ncbi:gamma-D-glutamyl-{L}-meso-diaminopimelate peptidase I Metallo peptidase. MEROPS family M14C [Caminicella sporogenes DSM 14501]|uniref:Gamma-D-glutamyl-(L)-meso-diaminopimelate peptidase I Metallo peptidase. MEROPS family M14C n=1 Tax=Caminicella sporogenes DSM 14501 TaxID=1121266 RepID=A0A1M6N4A9_9FIRM|nr:M14 family metallopeptidase [Caminicella sporogenes]RKD22368.1 peptidase M14 [Caminicella sporogenes]WIF95180.1 M14 family metallopeptidase [Caminicella sporogenes]SHJ90527.1 gamma-D-glutamyl-{L}-meso-diaminopimelate peptidase I Metallo peptidase. MEROPS family M14C [Caminicella sporogenes DSM 14501]